MAAMMGQGNGGGDVFAMRDMFLKERKKLDDRRKAAEGPSPMQVCATCSVHAALEFFSSSSMNTPPTSGIARAMRLRYFLRSFTAISCNA